MDAVLEIPSVKTRPAPFFTKENAKAYAAKGLIARKEAAIERERLVEQAKAQAAQTPDEYVKRRLLCVRARIDELDEELSKAANPQSINYLASAISKLQEEERKLAGRALPGSRRPGRESTTKRTGEVGPVE